MKKLQDIKRAVEVAVGKKLSRTKLRDIEMEIEDVLRQFNLERLNKGIDARGRRIKRLSTKYAAWKRRYAKGRLKHRPSSKGHAWHSRLYSDTTKYKAKGTPNYGRLTGKTLANIAIDVNARYKNGKIIIGINYDMTDEDKSDEIAEGLKKRGRDYYRGLAPRNTNVGKKERKKLRALIKRIL